LHFLGSTWGRIRELHKEDFWGIRREPDVECPFLMVCAKNQRSKLLFLLVSAKNQLSKLVTDELAGHSGEK
jgi:hypothetical protein